MMDEDPLIFLQDMFESPEQEKDSYIIHGHTYILYDIESMFKARVLKMVANKYLDSYLGGSEKYISQVLESNKS